MTSTLLTHGYVVTVDTERRVLPDGWISVRDDSIAALGPMSRPPEVEHDQVIDLQGMLTTPGLINGHTHYYGSIFKNTGEGLLLEDWLERIQGPLTSQLTLEDHRIAAYVNALEQLHTGTTCSLNHLGNVTDEETVTALVEPVLDVGLRQFVAKDLRETPDPPFAPGRPARPHARDRSEELALAEILIDRWQGAGGLIEMGLAIETAANYMLHNSTSLEIIRDGVALAERRGLKITDHCSAGTPWLSIREFHDATGGGEIDYLVRAGALSDVWVFVHGIWLSDREIEHIARAGASVITNPVSNAYSCDGIAPLKQMFAAGVNVGLGSDGTYVNCSADMVEQMKFAALIHNVTHLDPAFMTAERTLEMATINGARAMGMDHLIGSLEPGKRADIVAFDLGKPHTTVANRPLAALVFSAHGTDVDTVLVNGVVKLRQGRLVGFDRETEILAEARARAAAAIERAGLTGRVFQAWRT